MSMVFKNDTEMWTTLYLNHIKKSGKRGDLFVPFLNFINKITTTVCSSLYTWAVNKNCMEGFSNREVGCARNGEVSGSKCKERRECGEMGSVKKEGDSVKKGKVWQ